MKKYITNFSIRQQRFTNCYYYSILPGTQACYESIIIKYGDNFRSLNQFIGKVMHD